MWMLGPAWYIIGPCISVVTSTMYDFHTMVYHRVNIFYMNNNNLQIERGNRYGDDKK